VIALLSWRLWAALALAGILAVSHLSAYRAGRHAVQRSWDAAKVASVQAAQEQAERNRELQRQAELHYVVSREARERFQVVTIREIHDASAPLAACPLPDRVRLRLNALAACARTATCGPADEVPDAR
jgi:hypothetical protein